MSKIYQQDPYSKRLKEAPGTWFSSCCGAKYIKEPTQANMTRGYRGIRVAVGEILKPGVHKKQTVNVVNTKNGPLTIGVRHVW